MYGLFPQRKLISENWEIDLSQKHKYDLLSHKKQSILLFLFYLQKYDTEKWSYYYVN